MHRLILVVSKLLMRRHVRNSTKTESESLTKTILSVLNVNQKISSPNLSLCQQLASINEREWDIEVRRTNVSEVASAVDFWTSARLTATLNAALRWTLIINRKSSFMHTAHQTSNGGPRCRGKRRIGDERQTSEFRTSTQWQLIARGRRGYSVTVTGGTQSNECRQLGCSLAK